MKYVLLIGLLSLVAACSSLPNQGALALQQGESTTKTMDHKNRFFVAQKGVDDGYVFIIHIMPEPEGEVYSRNYYHLMVSVEKNNQTVTDFIMSSHIKHPDGMVEENKSMMRIGDWYMARYNLDHEKGQHWIKLSFQKADKIYSTGIYYPERVYRGTQ